ncbi:MAG: nucleotidyltransferase family protein [Anaerolineae bacterium]
MKFLRNEDEFIVQLLRTRHRPEYQSEVERLLRLPLDWEYIDRFLFVHALRALFFDTLRTLHLPEISTEIYEHYHRVYLANTLRNMYLCRELVKLYELTRQQNIPLMTFKGVALSKQIYGSVSEREIEDIDVLVQPEHLTWVKEALLAQGFEFHLREDGLSVDEKIKHEYHYSLYRRKPRLLTEIHWSLGRREFSKMRNPALFWENSTFVDINGTPIPTPTIEVALIYLCMHGFKHSWRRLAWIYDLAQILYAYPDINWDVLLHRADDLRARRMVLQGLYLAHRIFAVSMPVAAEQAMEKEDRLRKISEQIEEQTVTYPVEEAPVDDFVFQYAVRQGWTDRIYYLLAKARPNRNERQFAPMFSRMVPILYLIRIPRLIVRYLIPYLFTHRKAT